MIEQTTTLVLVTKDHIACGIVKDCEKCPVALAVLDALGKPTGALIEVDRMTVDVALPGERWHAELPPIATSFIDDFDNLEGVAAPFNFTLTWRIAEDPLS